MNSHISMKSCPLFACATLAVVASLAVPGCASGGGGTGGTAIADAAAKDSGAGDAAKADATATVGDTTVAGADGTKADGTTPAGDTATAASADVPQQDTGVTKDEIAKQTADAKKAEADLYLAFCKLNFVCATGFPWTNAQACRDELLVSGGLVFFGEGLAAIAAGKAKFNAAGVAACVATLDSKCTFFKGGRLPQACQDMFTGLVDNGNGCDQDYDCKNKFCKKKDANDPACQGVCAAPAKAGATCAGDAGCEMPNVCSDASKCAPYAPAAKGDDCTDVECAEGLVCVPDGDSNTCVDPAPEGAPCYVGDYACKKELFCVTNKVDTAGKCAKRFEASKACDLGAVIDNKSEDPCQTDFGCIEIATDATAGTCEPIVSVGKPCKSVSQCKGYDEDCVGAVADKMVCAYLPGKGGTCAPLDQADIDAGYLDCLPPFVCNGKTKKCVERPPVGDPCIEQKCAADLWCDTGDSDIGVCAAFGKAGEACTTFVDESSSCIPSLICGAKDDKCVAPVCK